MSNQQGQSLQRAIADYKREKSSPWTKAEVHAFERLLVSIDQDILEKLKALAYKWQAEYRDANRPAKAYEEPPFCPTLACAHELLTLANDTKRHIDTVLSHNPPPKEVDYKEKYHELLYAVGTKYPGETRHQTALRYIQRAESPTNHGPAQQEKPR